MKGLAIKTVIDKYGIYGKDKGLFATRAYKKGELIVVAQGAMIKDTDRRLTHRGVQIGPHSFIEPKRGSAVWYMNHSCRPSAYVDMEKVIARRNISPGEEITADYSLFIDFPSWDMHCACKAKICRRLIVPYSRLKRKPKEYISSYLR